MPHKTVEEWRLYWDAKAGIADPIVVNDYLVNGQPLTRDQYYALVVEPCLERLELEPEHAVLEIGCGTGLILGEIEKRVKTAVGTDLSEKLLARFPGKSRVHRLAAHEVNFPPASFDRILLVSVAIYFPSADYLQRVIFSCLSMLKSPGILLVGDLLLGQGRAGSEYTYYDRHSLVDLLEPLGSPYTIAAQSRAKRQINRRYDLIIYKD